MYIYNIWSILPRDSSKNLIDLKWVFKILEDESSKIKRYKIHLVARGSRQRKGLDCTEPFYQCNGEVRLAENVSCYGGIGRRN